MDRNEVIDIASRRELFVDRLLIDRLENARLQLHEPVSGGVAIGIDRPWEGPANGPQEGLGRGPAHSRSMGLHAGGQVGGARGSGHLESVERDLLHPGQPTPHGRGQAGQ